MTQEPSSVPAPCPQVKPKDPGLCVGTQDTFQIAPWVRNPINGILEFFPGPRNLQRRVSQWQSETFGPAQTVAGIDAHLVREVGELLDAKCTEDAILECADIVILLMGRASIMGEDLLDAVERKLAINRQRTWGKPDHQGVISHVEDPR